MGADAPVGRDAEHGRCCAAVNASAPVLLVEDDLDILEMGRELLEQSGLRVETAVNGAEALVRLSEMERPCVILLDLFMPVMDGLEFLQTLRADRDRARAAIPVVVVSAAVGRDADEASLMADGFLRKPVPVGTFLEAVSRYCRCEP